MLGIIVSAVIAVMSLLVYATCTFQVEEYERAVVTRFGVIQDIVGPGLRWRNPLINSVTEFRVDNQRITNHKHPANVYTIDNQEVNVIYQVVYQLPGSVEGLTFIYKEAQNYEYQLDGLITDRLKRELGTVNLNSLAKERNKVTETIERRLEHDMLEIYKIKLISFQMLDVSYTTSFRQAVEKAAEAKAGIETREQERLQAEKAAETLRLKAQGEADAKWKLYEVEIRNTEQSGLAAAKALEAQGKALAANPRLVEYEQAKRWTGALPHYMGVGALPFMSLPTDATKTTLDAGLSKR